ncbi:MAG: GntR family transcriptional regulator [Corynebacterium provencense]|jgi:GntR family transcriptional regulator|uniref:GntR family transcriptional regulator n=1 Tax=Corynebacterium provencense TaxID=1737425 RepID=UPI002989F8DB|nr:GntR family transcriptional regulator [Corynebacterium provencense]
MSSQHEVEKSLTRLCEEMRAGGTAKLPSERDLALRLGASRSTVRRVLDAMQADGALYRVRGRAGGAFLTGVSTGPPVPEDVPGSGEGRRKVLRDLNQVKGIPQMLSEQGYRDGTQVVRAALEAPSPAVAGCFGSSGPVVSLLRVRFADGEALSLEHAYLPAPRFPGLLNHPLTSLYALLASEYGTVVGRTEEIIEATAATAPVSGFLHVSPGAPLLKVTRRAWAEDVTGDVTGEVSGDAVGEVSGDAAPVEFSVDLFRADRTSLTVRSDRPGAKLHHPFPAGPH